MFKLAHKGLFLVLLPVAFELLFVWQVQDLLEKTDKQIEKEAKAAEMLEAGDKFMSQIIRANGAAICYSCWPDPKYIRVHDETVIAMRDDLRHIQEMVGNNKRIQLALNMVARHQGKTARFRRMMMTDSAAQARISALFGGRSMSSLVAKTNFHHDELIDELGAHNRKVEKEAQRQAAAINEALQRWMLAAGLAACTITLLTAVFFQRSIVIRLRRILQNIDRMTKREPLMPPHAGTDEIAQLDQAVADTGKSISQLESFRTQAALALAEKLNAPVQSIRSALVNLRANGFERVSDVGEQRLDDSKKLIDRLTLLIGDLTAINKYTQARFQLDITESDLRSLVQGAVQATSTLGRDRGVSVVVQVQDASVACDRLRLEQVLINMISNAVKFSPDNAQVLVEATASADRVQISVLDSGRGVDPTFRSRIFHRFEQATESDQGTGSGLGLAISRELVEAHGGTMDFESHPGRTKFYFSIPRVAKQSAAKAPPDAAAVRPRSSGLWRKSAVVLVTPLVVQISTIGVLCFLLDRAHYQMEQFRHARQLASVCTELTRHLMLAGAYSMLYNSEHYEPLRAVFDREQPILEAKLDELKCVTSGNAVETKRANDLEAVIRKAMTSTKNLVDSNEQDITVTEWVKRCPELPQLYDETSAFGMSLRGWIKEGQGAHGQQLAMSQEARTQIMIALYCGLAVSFLATIALAIAFTKGVRERLHKITVNTRRLADGDPLLEPDNQNTDEIATVDREFYAAANHLRELDRFRMQLLSVTSHELRTPLTALLGNFELMEAGVVGQPSVAGTHDIEEGKARTAILVSDITEFLNHEKRLSTKS